MLEYKIKEVIRWGVTIKGSDVYFPKKETAIKIGNMSLQMNPETKMFKKYRLWHLLPGKPPELIDKQRFDRTILIQ